MIPEYDTGERFMIGVEMMTAVGAESEYALVNNDMQRLMVPVIEEALHLSEDQLLNAAHAMDNQTHPLISLDEKRCPDEDRQKLTGIYQYFLTNPPRPLELDESYAHTYALLDLRINYATRKFRVGYGTVYCDDLADFEAMYRDPGFQAAGKLISHLICQLNLHLASTADR